MEAVKTLLRLLYRKPQYFEDGMISIHTCDFRNKPDFKRAKQVAMGKTGVHFNADWNLHTMLWAAKRCSELEGDFVECGVDRGYTMRACAEYVGWNHLKKKMYLVDTFEGFPKDLGTEEERKGNCHFEMHQEYQGTYDEVKRAFNDCSNIEVVKGRIPEVLNDVETNLVAFLSIDLNSAVSEIASIDYFWPKMVKGGIVVLDDYAQSSNYRVQRRAWDLWAVKNGVQILTLATGQGMIVN